MSLRPLSTLFIAFSILSLSTLILNGTTRAPRESKKNELNFMQAQRVNLLNDATKFKEDQNDDQEELNAETRAKNGRFENILVDDYCDGRQLRITEDVTIGGELSTTGIARFNSDVTILGNTVVIGEAIINGDTTLIGDIKFTGTILSEGDFTTTGTLKVESALSIDDSISSTAIAANPGISLLLIDADAQAVDVAVTFPDNPTHGQLFTLISGTNSGLTLTNIAGAGGATFPNSPVTLLKADAPFNSTENGASVTYIYLATTNAWYKFLRG